MHELVNKGLCHTRTLETTLQRVQLSFRNKVMFNYDDNNQFKYKMLCVAQIVK